MYNVMYTLRRYAVARMVRKQIYIRQRQQQALKRLAKARDVSEAEVIRQMLDEQLGGTVVRPFVPDHDAWQKFLDFADTFRPATPTPYKWRREDAYEERLEKLERRIGSG